MGLSTPESGWRWDASSVDGAVELLICRCRVEESKKERVGCRKYSALEPWPRTCPASTGRHAKCGGAVGGKWGVCASRSLKALKVARGSVGCTLTLGDMDLPHPGYGQLRSCCVRFYGMRSQKGQTSPRARPGRSEQALEETLPTFHQCTPDKPVDDQMNLNFLLETDP